MVIGDQPLLINHHSMETGRLAKCEVSQADGSSLFKLPTMINIQQTTAHGSRNGVAIGVGLATLRQQTSKFHEMCKVFQVQRCLFHRDGSYGCRDISSNGRLMAIGPATVKKFPFPCDYYVWLSYSNFAGLPTKFLLAANLNLVYFLLQYPPGYFYSGRQLFLSWSLL